MLRTYSLRGIIIVSTLLLLFFAATFKRPAISLLWRRALHGPLHLMRPYRAPMFGCEWPDVIQGAYFIFLHHGCTLEEHTETVGKQANLDWKITHVFPGADHHGLCYTVEEIDDVALDAIRTDIVVDMIECNRSPKAIEGETVEIIEMLELLT